MDDQRDKGFGRRRLLRDAGIATAAGAGIAALGAQPAAAAGLTAVTGYSVKDYGAVGNGSTNDRTAIQNAMNAAGTTGGIVYFPPGDYVVNGPLVPKKNTVLLGSHTPHWRGGVNPDSASKIRMQSGFTGGAGLLLPAGGTYGVRVQNLALVGNNIGSGLHGLKFPDLADYTGNESWVLDGVSISGFSGNGISGCAQTTQVTNCMFDNNIGWGIDPGNGNRWNDCHFTNCFFFYNRQGNVQFSGTETSGLVMFSNCRFERAGTQPGNDLSPYNPAAPGVRLTNARQFHFVNCSTDANTGNGFEILNIASSSDYRPDFISLTNCFLNRDGTGSTSTLSDFAAIKVQGSGTSGADQPGIVRCSNCAVASGSAQDAGGGGVIGPKYGVWHERTSWFKWLGGAVYTDVAGREFYTGPNGGSYRPELNDPQRGLHTLPVDSPPAAYGASDGATYVDQSTNRLYVRVNGAWKYTTLT